MAKRTESIWEDEWIQIAIWLRTWMEQFEKLSPTPQNRTNIENQLKFHIEDNYSTKKGGPIKQFACRADYGSLGNVDVFTSVELSDNNRGSDICFTIHCDNVIAEFSEIEIPFTSSTHVHSDAIAAYNRAMGILDTR